MRFTFVVAINLLSAFHCHLSRNLDLLGKYKFYCGLRIHVPNSVKRVKQSISIIIQIIINTIYSPSKICSDLEFKFDLFLWIEFANI